MQIAWIEDKYLFRLRMDNKLRVKGILLFQPFNFILQTKLSTSLYNLFMVRWWCFCVLPFFSHHPISNTPNGNLFYTHIKFGGHFFREKQLHTWRPSTRVHFWVRRAFYEKARCQISIPPLPSLTYCFYWIYWYNNPLSVIERIVKLCVYNNVTKQISNSTDLCSARFRHS